MSFFLTACKAELIMLLKRKRAVALLLLPVCLMFISFIVPDDELVPAVPVGWAMPEDCRYGGELLELLRQEEGLVQFISADEDTLRANVAGGKWACGFVLRRDFDRRVGALRCRDAFTLVYAGDEALPRLVSEAVSSAMMVMLSREIGQEYLAQRGVEIPDSGWMLDNSQRLEILPVYSGELGLAPVARGIGGNVLRGAAGILLLMLSLAMADSLALRRRQMHHLRAAAVRGEGVLLVAALAVRVGLMFIFAAIGLAFCGALSVLPLLAMCLSLGGLMVLLSALHGGWSGAVLPFLPVALIILCPVFFDVSAFMPGLKWICGLIPVTHYLRGRVLPNIILCALFTSSGALINKIGKK